MQKDKFKKKPVYWMGKIMQLFCSFFLSRQFHAQFSAFNIFYTKHMEEFFMSSKEAYGGW